MAMMRRGPLAEYPVDWVLRQAAVHRVTGSIEFNSISPMTVYFNVGSVYHAIATVVPSDGQAPVGGRASSETSAREEVAEVLAGSLSATDGWYYHDPLSRHEGHGPWQWAVDVLLASAKTMTLLDQSLGPWAQVELGLRPTSDQVTLSADAWAVVVELTAQANTRAVRNRLDWEPDRLVAALDDLARAGAIPPVGPSLAVAPPGGDVVPAAVSASMAAAPQSAPVRPGVEPEWVPGSVGPDASRSRVPAGQDAVGDRRGALRRLIANLRPA